MVRTAPYLLLLLATVALVTLSVPAPSGVAASPGTVCHDAVRSHIWGTLRRDRPPVYFTTTSYYDAGPVHTGVRGTGRIVPPGAIDRFAYACTVNVRNGRVTITQFAGLTEPIGIVPVPPGAFKPEPICHAVVRQRIWQLRGGRLPVQFTSTDTVWVDATRRRVQGTGQVLASGYVDQFIYTCSVNIRTGGVRILRLESGVFTVTPEREIDP